MWGCFSPAYYVIVTHMRRFFDKLESALIELGILKFLIFLTTSYSFGIWALISFFKESITIQFTITIGEILSTVTGFILLTFVLWIAIRKIISRKKFSSDDRVTLSTLTYPIMTVGPYNFITNRIQCSWFDPNQIIQREWINQNELVLYIEKKSRAKQPSKFWTDR